VSSSQMKITLFAK